MPEKKQKFSFLLEKSATNSPFPEYISLETGSIVLKIYNQEYY